MKSLTEHLWFEIPNRRGFVNITGTVAGLLRKSGVQEGLCLVNAMHITAHLASTAQRVRDALEHGVVTRIESS